MRLIKMLGLAAIAALATTAVVGVASSSANSETVLCKKAELVCAAANRYEPGTHIEAELLSGTKAKLVGALNIECSKSTVLGHLTTGLGPTQLGRLLSLTFSECNNCEEITSTGHYGAEGWLIHLKNLGELKGSLTVLNPLVLLKGCSTIFGKISCTASAEEVLLDVDPKPSGKEGDLEILAVNEPLSLGICGNGTWNASYIVVLPLPAYIES